MKKKDRPGWTADGPIRHAFHNEPMNAVFSSKECARGEPLLSTTAGLEKWQTQRT